MKAGLKPNLDDGVDFGVVGRVRIDGKNGQMVFVMNIVKKQTIPIIHA